jgi:hypothetical protein
MNYKNLTDEEILEILDRQDNSYMELKSAAQTDSDLRNRLFNLKSKHLEEKNNTLSVLIEQLEKALNNDEVPDEIKSKIELKLIKYKSLMNKPLSK